MKGIVFSLEAIMAISLLIIFAIVISFIGTTSFIQHQTYERFHYSSQDAVELLTKTKVSFVVDKFPAIKDLKERGILRDEDLDKSLLDVIGSLWVNGSVEEARNITESILNLTVPENLGYEVSMDGTSVAKRDKPVKSLLSVSKTTVSGYAIGKPVEGYTARAYLEKILGKNTASYFYFGGFVGQGNLTAIIRDIPLDASISSIYIEGSFGSNFTLYINKSFCGIFNKSSTGYFAVDSFLITDGNCLNKINKGYGNETAFDFNFTSSDINLKFIGGGYIKVTYDTTEFASPRSNVYRYYFPGIYGLINLYDSFYLPGTLNETLGMRIHLHYYNNLTAGGVGVPMFLNIGGIEVNRTNATHEQIIDLSFENISEKFGGKDNLIRNVSNRTVPIRFGSEEFQAYGGVGLADAVLITDISGSMNSDDVVCNKSWEISTRSYEGIYAIRNKLIGDNRYACIYRNVTLISGGNISFWWRVSSQANSDYLLFCLDLPTCSLSTYTQRISGSIGWTNVRVNLVSGNHEIRWCYAKDGSGSGGSDVGYVDLILVNDSRGTIFREDFEDTVLDGWYFSSNVAYFYCRRLEVAKDVDFVFVDTVLNVSGNRVGLVSYNTTVSSTHSISNDSTTLKGNISQYVAGGCTCISCGINRAIQMLNAVSEPRFKGMLVMSDGYANQCILGDNGCQFAPKPPGCPDNSSRDYPPKLEAINMSCEARRLNYTVFSVAFGNGADRETLQKIACWNCSACPPNADPSNPNCWIGQVTLPNGSTADCRAVRYAQSNNYEELKKIYKEFAEYFAGAYVTQRMNITGGVSLSNALYPDSYIEFYYQPEAKEEYGEISLKVETNPFGCNGTFLIPSQVKVLDIIRTSYSSDFWSRKVLVNNSENNWQTVWSLDSFGSNYVYLGDPFQIQFSPSRIKSGENNTIGLILGLGPTNTSGICSSRDRTIYTASFKSYTTYSPIVFPYLEGRNITVYYDRDHDGTADGSYPVTIGRNLPRFNSTLGVIQDLNVTHNAVDYAFLMLLNQLNFIGTQLPSDPLSLNRDEWPGTENNPIDIMITPEILFETLYVAAVPSLWGPTNLEIKVWA